MRRLIIGDIHGCLAELKSLLDAFQYVPGKDNVYSVGDLINNGPDSLGVLQLFWKLGIKGVLGNHEVYFLKVYRTPPALRSEKEQTYLKQFKGKQEEMAQYFASLPTWIEHDDLWIVHAGLDPRLSHPSQMEPRILTTIRTWDGLGEVLHNPLQDPPWYRCRKWSKTVVFGHWAARGLVDLVPFKGLDGGCVYGKELLGYCPEENKIYRVQAKESYQKIT